MRKTEKEIIERTRCVSILCDCCKLVITRFDGSIHSVIPLKAWRERCRCECKTGGPCEHDFSGPVVYTKNSGSVVCRHCGMTAMAHDIKLF